jgi:para-aminobenzoate synthetase
MSDVPVRTLLIDNYDSYTYNLFQQLARINGCDPVVVSNDGATAGELAALDVDNIVISPGPGRPENPRDFNVCTDLLKSVDIPLLGVCLGHQGIAVAAGGSTTAAPVVMHGRLSRVRHCGALFAGVPQDFEAVRYHSLRVSEPLPGGLVGTAWASDDGTLMALQETQRPVYGVQFHPESILTSHGDQIIANFRDLSRSWWREAGHARHASRRRFFDIAPQPRLRSRGAAFPRTRTAPALVMAKVDGPIDPELAFDAVRGAGPAVWLDSAAEGVGTGRFSYLALGAGALAETVFFDVGEREVQVRRQGRVTRLPGASLFDYIAGQLASRTPAAAPAVPFEFLGGYVGWIGYEARSETGMAGPHLSPVPDAALLFADRVVAIDHVADTAYLVALAPQGDEAEVAQARSWLSAASADLAALRGQVSPALRPACPATARIARPDRTRAQYLADIGRCKELLTAGDTYEVCLTNQFRVPIAEQGLDIYRRLRRLNAAPYGAYLSFGGTEVCSSSPECFVKIGRDRTIQVRPIKGTARRDKDPVQDERLRKELANDEKERAENLMIVDLLRNDLGKVCQIGTVDVPLLMEIETFPTVHQMVTTIRGELRPRSSVADYLRAVFPGGSMTGAPKIRTMEIIDQLEGRARGAYSGGLGYFSIDGAAELSVIIRTIVCQDGNASIGAGGAVTILSDPEDEWQEVVLKANAVLRAVNATIEEDGP